MKSRKIIFGTFLIVLAFAMATIGCDTGSDADDLGTNSSVPEWAIGTWYDSGSQPLTRVRVAEVTSDQLIKYKGIDGNTIDFVTRFIRAYTETGFSQGRGIVETIEFENGYRIVRDYFERVLILYPGAVREDGQGTTIHK